ncbi:hypothetical protein [Croceicoccus gelatinilyticus]|uniref:hypothetical protein n=1 Tax=Croceicoccus gelatinilyticus TaxID=2835536 RepID=UPI001BCB4F4F|nr:hypothetical protein [Croceicoccus gelatinilyticus]MBS7671335.1 hypothetical protein [Croceicoccus gelatinilyticus]
MNLLQTSTTTAPAAGGIASSKSGIVGADSAETPEGGEFSELFEALSIAVAPMQLTDVVVTTKDVAAAPVTASGKNLPPVLPPVAAANPAIPAKTRDLWAVLAESGKLLPPTSIAAAAPIKAGPQKLEPALLPIGTDPVPLELPEGVAVRLKPNGASISFPAGNEALSDGEIASVVERALSAVVAKEGMTQGRARPAVVEMSVTVPVAEQLKDFSQVKPEAVPATPVIEAKRVAGEAKSLANPTGSEASALIAADRTKEGVRETGTKSSRVVDGSYENRASDTATAAQMRPITGTQSEMHLQLTVIAPAENRAPVAAAPAGHVPAEGAGMTSVERIGELVQAISRAHEESGQPVKTTVQHAEFGVLAVRLSREDRGLMAQISSADAGFAPAAHSAVRAMAEPQAQTSRGDEQARHHSGAQDQSFQSNSQASGSQGQATGRGPSREEIINSRGPLSSNDADADAAATNHESKGGRFA